MEKYISERYPLSTVQSRIWYVERLYEGTCVNNLPYIIQMDGKLDYKLLNESFCILINRHQLLRTVFYEENGIPYQCTLDNYDYQIETNEIKLREGQIEEDWLQKYIEVEIKKSFSLSEAPPFRLSLIKAASNRHYLIFVIHHIIADGWSIGLLFRDLATAYNSLCGQSKPDFPPIRQEYQEYVEYCQKLSTNDENYLKAIEFWKSKLKNAKLSIDLTFDYPYSGMDCFEGASEIFRIPEFLAEQMTDLCRQMHTTPFMFLLSCLYIFLYVHSGQQDIAIGVPVAGRENKLTEQTVGPYINTSVFRHILETNNCFQDLLCQVRDESLEAYAYGSCTFEDIVRHCFPRNYADQQMTLPVMLSVQTFPMDIIDFPELRLQVKYPRYVSIPTALSFTFWPSGKTMMCSLEYNKGLWKDSTALRMIERFINIVEQVVTNYKKPISNLDILPRREKTLILKNWANGRDALINKTVHEMFCEQVKNTPENIAFSNGKIAVSYCQLHKKSCQIAGYLNRKGIGEGDMLCIHLTQSYDFIVIALAILMCGACYVPIDPELDQKRKQFIVKDVNPTLIISKAKADWNISTPCVIEDIDVLIDSEYDYTYDTFIPRSLDTPACVIYTSGSTGFPKGVVLEHKGISNLIQSFISCYNTTENDRILPVTSVGSASFVGEIFPILCCGGTLVLAEKTLLLDKNAFLRYVDENRITIISTVPSMLMQLNNKDIMPPSLRILLSGGEVLTNSMVDLIKTQLKIYNGYGLTETSICNTYCEIYPECNDLGMSLPVGKPIINNQIYILNEEKQPVPIGVCGEIYVAGAGVARGYLNQAELTHEKFSVHPFQESEFVFATGDLGKWNENGMIEFLGRKDKQIKIRGYRVEIDEIEKVIESHPEIQQCIVDHSDKRGLIAYLSVKSDYTLYKEDLIEWVQERLPFYMRPSNYYLIPMQQLSQNGKKNREVSINQVIEIKNKEIYSKSNELIEDVLFDIFSKLVKHDNFTVNDTFFDIGGHSLLLTQLQSEIEKHFGKKIALEKLLLKTSVYSLSIFLRDNDASYRTDINDKIKSTESQRINKRINNLNILRDRKR